MHLSGMRIPVGVSLNNWGAVQTWDDGRDWIKLPSHFSRHLPTWRRSESILWMGPGENQHVEDEWNPCKSSMTKDATRDHVIDCKCSFLIKKKSQVFQVTFLPILTCNTRFQRNFPLTTPTLPGKNWIRDFFGGQCMTPLVTPHLWRESLDPANQFILVKWIDCSKEPAGRWVFST